jgi:DNA-binding transcriptional MerR regulator
MLTIGKVGRRFGLSRTALIYYDKIGLLKPSSRSAANYRLYTEKDLRKLEKINQFRQAGIPLEQITQLLYTDSPMTISTLELRLHQLNREIEGLREQQQVIVNLLQNHTLLSSTPNMTKARWIGLLRTAGMSDEAMQQWHVAFEAGSPETHQAFLQSVGIAPEEIEQIRAWAKKGIAC